MGQQAALHEDVVGVRGFFYCLVLNIDASASAQTLMREISGGRRDFPPGLLAMFRRYRTRIPPLPGLWRTSVLQKLAVEGAPPLEAEGDHDLEPGAGGPPHPLGKGKDAGPPSLARDIRNNLAVLLLVIPPFFMTVVGAKRVASEGSCEQPVGTMVLLDGLLLVCAGLGGGGFRVNRRRFSALAGTWLFPSMFVAFLLHLALVVGLLFSIAGVDRIGGRDDGDGRSTCSSGTFAWGILFLVLNLLCLVTPPVVKCVKCYNRAVKPSPVSVIPENKRRESPGRDEVPI